ncbi:hypothetical protein [Streptomyces sp. N35]|uniref:hypothetical protein n=1 Tax=Streptomyces sp. N35 TaxID=2795730 RepID=UPI0018F3B83A|nr:hypothetical protein [Streptomyces sp. N35]
MRELLAEFVGDAMLSVLACLTVLGLAMAFAWGWSISPLLAGGTGAAVLLFLAYGGWELHRPIRPGRATRLATAATATFIAAAALALYAADCACT